MDKPKRDISWLESFPRDIWAYFASYLPGEQLLRLMMTGATLLRQQLKSPTVVKSIKLGSDFIVFKSLPPLLRDFPSLEELSIYSFDRDWSDKLGLTIDSIPSGVQKLELRGHWGDSVTNLFAEPDRPLNFAEHLPQLVIFEYLGYNPSYTWMDQAPQSLTRLAIQLWDGSVELPSSLIHFQVNIVDLSADSFVSKCPPLLETFLVDSELIGLNLIVPLLPPTIRHLSLGHDAVHSDGASVKQKLLEQLPKSLTSLTIPNCSEINFETKPELISLLPPTVTDLIIHPEFPVSAWSLFPTPNLRKLSIRVAESLSTVTSTIVDKHGIQHEVTTIPFNLLPRSITKLEMSLQDQYVWGPPTTSSSLSYFPPHLTYLEISLVQLSPEAAKLLPPSLTYLEIGNFCERVCEHIPSGVKTLKSLFAVMSPNLIKFLPKSLTHLYLEPLPDYMDYFDYNTGQRVEFGSISDTPEYALHKSCISKSFDWKDFSPLPATLTYLNLGEFHELGDSFMLHQQLPNLQTFTAPQSNHFSDIIIPLLPRRLTYLSLLRSNMVTGKSFPFLPRSLTELDLSSYSIFDSDIQHLPRTLTKLCFSQAIHLTDSCVPDLPPHLQTLLMETNSGISTHSFPKFPYPLRSSSGWALFRDWVASSGVVARS